MKEIDSKTPIADAVRRAVERDLVDGEFRWLIATNRRLTKQRRLEYAVYVNSNRTADSRDSARMWILTGRNRTAAERNALVTFDASEQGFFQGERIDARLIRSA